MKKYFLIGIIMAIVPNICFGASARFTQLAREKERKMAELEKCMGSTKGLKIAGISTLGLSAVGVAANVIEAKKIKDYDSSIESTTQQIEKTKTEINEKTDELQKKSQAGQTKNESTDNYSSNDDENIVGVAFLHNGTCRVYTENHKWNDVDETQCSKNLSKGSWFVKKDGESINGDSTCASNGMGLAFGATGTPIHSTVGVGEYCWCKINSGPGTSNDWILSTDAINIIPNQCESYCAHNCAYAALNNSLGVNNTSTESKNDTNLNPKSSEGNSDNSTNSDPGSGNSNSGNNNGSNDSNTETQAQDTTCGNLGQKECNTNYKICEKDGQTKDCTGDMLPRYATKGHCVSAGRKDYKICTATDCDDKHTLSNGHCNTQKTQENKISNQNTNTNNTTVTSNNNNTLQSYIDTDGTGYIAHNLSGSCYTSEKWSAPTATCLGLKKGEWIVKFDYGLISGTSRCANNGGSYAVSGNPDGDNGQYCWCKMTKNNIPSLSSASLWVFRNDDGSAVNCAYFCANYCAFYVQSDSALRAGLFGSVAQ